MTSSMDGPIIYKLLVIFQSADSFENTKTTLCNNKTTNLGDMDLYILYFHHGDFLEFNKSADSLRAEGIGIFQNKRLVT